MPPLSISRAYTGGLLAQVNLSQWNVGCVDVGVMDVRENLFILRFALLLTKSD